MPGATVRWGVAGRMFIAWGLTLPAAGLVGALCHWLESAIGGAAGTLAVVAVLMASSAAIWIASRRRPVDHTNVNEKWDETKAVGVQPVAATTGEAGGERVGPVPAVATASSVGPAIDSVRTDGTPDTDTTSKGTQR
jgi:PiT family inorganic phosphate transporter